MSKFFERLAKQKKKSDLDHDLAAAIRAYAADHPTEAPEPEQKPIPRRLRALLPRPARQHPEPAFLEQWRREARQQPLPPPDLAGVPSSAPARSGAGSLSSELPPILKDTHLVFARDELGRIAGATANDGVRRCEMKAVRDSEGRMAAVHINGVKFQVQRDAEGRVFALAS